MSSAGLTRTQHRCQHLAARPEIFNVHLSAAAQQARLGSASDHADAMAATPWSPHCLIGKAKLPSWLFRNIRQCAGYAAVHAQLNSMASAVKHAKPSTRCSSCRAHVLHTLVNIFAGQKTQRPRLVFVHSNSAGRPATSLFCSLACAGPKVQGYAEDPHRLELLAVEHAC